MEQLSPCASEPPRDRNAVNPQHRRYRGDRHVVDQLVAQECALSFSKPAERFTNRCFEWLSVVLAEVGGLGRVGRPREQREVDSGRGRPEPPGGDNADPVAKLSAASVVGDPRCCALRGGHEQVLEQTLSKVLDPLVGPLGTENPINIRSERRDERSCRLFDL